MVAHGARIGRPNDTVMRDLREMRDFLCSRVR